MKVDLKREIAVRAEKAYKFIHENLPHELASSALAEGAWHYLERGGKGLRPALLMLCCGAVGGDEEKAVPAAAAVEVAHNWTLVHDDIMDRDEIRRGRPTVHALLRQKALARGLPPEEAEHYSISMALTAGDLMHAWSVLLCLKSVEKGVPPEVALAVARKLEEALVRVIEGQALDLDLSRRPLDEIGEEEVLEMMRLKTAALLRFCAEAGAMLGKSSPHADFPEARALSDFAENCGLAFQMRDDLLDLFGSEEETGKPVGSDTKEGKRTLLVMSAYRSLGDEERGRLAELLGNSDLDSEGVEEFRSLVERSGAREEMEGRARHLASRAEEALGSLPSTPQREALSALARFVVERER